MRKLATFLLVFAFILSVAGIAYTAVTLHRNQTELATLSGRLATLQCQIADLAGPSSTGSPAASQTVAEARSLTEAEAVVQRLGSESSAQQMAECLAEIDSWTVPPTDESQMRELKLGLAVRLRRQVKQEVAQLQQAALKADTGADAAKKHAEAGQVLALYPMSDDKAVLEEAKDCSAQQAECGNRLEVVRRQRYNQWAAKQIEAAIDGYHSNSSIWSPKKENALLIASLVKTLGEVDPSIIEPVVLELYNYVVDITKGSISEKDKIELAKKMTDPSIKRKTLGDF